jgi:hypothetical protein
MRLILRPPGRGNWKPVQIELRNSKHAPLPLEVHVGQRWVLGQHVFRVAKVMP